MLLIINHHSQIKPKSQGLILEYRFLEEIIKTIPHFNIISIASIVDKKGLEVLNNLLFNNAYEQKY